MTEREDVMLTILRALTVGVLAAFGAFATFASAQEPGYPTRVIRIVPFGTAGGPIDIVARMYAERLTQRWGQPVIVDPKPGASGIIAADFVAKAPADGYTLLMTMTLTHVNNAIVFSKLPYDPVRDFEPVSELATGGPALVAPALAPFNDLREFIDYARSKGRVTYGTWGLGSSAHLFGESLKRQAGIPLDHVPYKAESQAHVDMFGGSLEVSWANPGTARNHRQAGKIKVLAVAGSRRLEVLPGVPTFAEEGIKGLDLDSWIAVYAPAKTPRAVVDRIAAALRDITNAPEVRARLIDTGFAPLGTTPEQFAENYRTDFPRWAEIIKSAGVKVE
jgi:tripartite-type tricarboxylate transporter receptor subunit TctC